VKKTRTTAFRPQGNGQVERFNQTLHDLLRSLPSAKKIRWPDYLNELVFAYNTTPHASTGFTPFYMMYGRQARLGPDILLGIGIEGDDKAPDSKSWVTLHQRRLQEAYEIARKRLDLAANKRKIQADKKSKEFPLYHGQLVYTRNRGVKGRNKIQDAYKPDVFKVIDKRGEHDVYCIERADGQGGSRWVNRAELREIPIVRANGPTKVRHKRTRTLTTKEDTSPSTEDERFVMVRDMGSESNLHEESLSSTESGSGDSVMPLLRVRESATPPTTEVNQDADDLPLAVRRPRRKTAGYHNNPFHKPKPVLNECVAYHRYWRSSIDSDF
jgi:hypothetical protein